MPGPCLVGLRQSPLFLSEDPDIWSFDRQTWPGCLPQRWSSGEVSWRSGCYLTWWRKIPKRNRALELGKSWKIMENHGKSWKIMENHGKSWKIMENTEIYWVIIWHIWDTWASTDSNKKGTFWPNKNMGFEFATCFLPHVILSNLFNFFSQTV